MITLIFFRCCFARAAVTGRALVLMGCQGLEQPGSASFAAVRIRGHSADEIRGVTSQVFLENGYAGSARGAGDWLFEKEGTRANDLASNGVVGTHYGQHTKVRVKVQLIAEGGGVCRLQCQVSIVRHAGDSFFEEEIPLKRLRRRPYQNLLEEVADRLK